MRAKRWYTKREYEQPREPFDPGDGSLVEVVKDADERHPEALKTTRVWPDGKVTTIRFVPASQLSHKLYLSIEGDVQPEQKLKGPTLDEQLSNGNYRAPFAITSAVPGNRPGDTYDSATDRHFETRAKFSQYYREHHLEKVSPNDSLFKFDAAAQGEGTPSNVQGFDPKQGPSKPKGFEGVPFKSVESMAQANAILRG